MADAFRKRPDIKVVSLVHHDTPSGTINPAREIGKIVREHDGLLIVDAVSSFGGMDIHPDDCFADIFITGPGKCLGGAPGLTIMSVTRPRLEAHRGQPEGAVRVGPQPQGLEERLEQGEADFPFTPSVAEMNGLDGALDQYLDEGPENVWRRHALTARACRAGIKAMGLELWAKTESIASPTCTAVRVPAGVNDEEISRRRAPSSASCSRPAATRPRAS